MSEDFKKKLLNRTKKEFYNCINQFKKDFRPSKSLQGFSSGVIVCEKNYPNLNLIPLNNYKEESHFSKEKEIVKKDYSEIFKIKSRNIAGKFNLNIKNKNKNLDNIRDIIASKKKVEYESIFKKEIKINNIVTNNLIGIVGSKNELKEIKKGNVPRSKIVDKYMNDDIKSEDAVYSLYCKKVNENQIISLFTLGSFGYSFNKKLVPSRWGTTAYDSIISERLYDEIKHNKIINKNLYFFKEDKGNRFHIFMFSHKHTFESIEIIYNKNDIKIIQDYIIDNKRIDPNTAGGFYATRLAVLEFLNRIKRQASIVVIREIKDYEIPLGVIFVRETVRDALKKVYSFNKIDDLKPILQSKVFSVLKKSKTINKKTLLDF